MPYISLKISKSKFGLANLILFLILSCTKVTVQPNSQPTVLAPVLSEEEILRKQALEKYRLLRISSPRKEKSYTLKASPIRTSLPRKPQKRLGDKVAISREIDQNLDYFCMKHRKNIRFKDPLLCRKLALEKKQYCDQLFEEEDRSLVYCIKKELRKILNSKD